jgi:hypothetical protein
MTGTWASLQEATETVRAAGVKDPAEAITRAVSAAMLVRPGALPLPDRTPPAPRLRVITQRTVVGMDWLQAPVLDFEKSEILCRSYMAGTQEQFTHPRDLHPARIELWNDDLLRLWPAAGGDQPSSAPRDTAEEACRKLIVSLDNSGMKKAEIYARAQKEIRDLSLVEFKRAWHDGAKLLTKRGRRAG